MAVPRHGRNRRQVGQAVHNLLWYWFPGVCFTHGLVGLLHGHVGVDFSHGFPGADYWVRIFFADFGVRIFVADLVMACADFVVRCFLRIFWVAFPQKKA